MHEATVVASIEIAASPETVYGIIMDLSRWQRFVVEAGAPRAAGIPGLAPGVTFHAWNRHGPWRWRTTATVLEALPPRRLSFRVSWLGRPVSTWRYDIVPTARGSRVTESTRDRRSRPMCVLSVAASGVVNRARRNRRNIAATLARLKAEAERPPAGHVQHTASRPGTDL